MKSAVVFTIILAAIVCFAAGWFSGNSQDRWKIAQQKSCVANLQIVDPGPPQRHLTKGITAVRPRLLTSGRRDAILGAFQQIERCNDLSGLATMDPLTVTRLHAMIENP